MLSSFNAHPQQTNKKQNQAGLEDGASFPASGRSRGRRHTLVQGYKERPHLACLFPAPGSGSVSLAACSWPLWQCLYQGNRFRTSESWLLNS